MTEYRSDASRLIAMLLEAYNISKHSPTPNFCRFQISLSEKVASESKQKCERLLFVWTAPLKISFSTFSAIHAVRGSVFDLQFTYWTSATPQLFVVQPAPRTQFFSQYASAYHHRGFLGGTDFLAFPRPLLGETRRGDSRLCRCRFYNWMLQHLSSSQDYLYIIQDLTGGKHSMSNRKEDRK